MLGLYPELEYLPELELEEPEPDMGTCPDPDFGLEVEEDLGLQLSHPPLKPGAAESMLGHVTGTITTRAHG